MLELALVVTALMAVAFVGIASAIVTPGLLAAVGFGILLLGLLLGLPTGFWYHVVLYRFVSAKMALPRSWWLSPSMLHIHLTGAERRRIKPWYLVGGVGFALSVLGGVVAIAGLLMGR
jgi:hypothetical protein